MIKNNYEYETNSIYPTHISLVDAETGYIVKFGKVRFVDIESEIGHKIKPLQKPLDAFEIFTGKLNKKTWNYVNKTTPEEIKASTKNFYDEFKFIDPIHIKQYAPNIYNAEVTALTLCDAWKRTDTVDIFNSENLPPGSKCRVVGKDSI